ncbi:ketopantoate reductase C-terminal domain-containing protein [Amycolatopsis sp. NPDC051128]|uniref:ketopantoate reductase C-terminal domain-containing protein n=1 Tax=Amycolatopsis sp. NPDC051128 TaxID=3155412 RepID=UPI003423F7FE
MEAHHEGGCSRGLLVTMMTETLAIPRAAGSDPSVSVDGAWRVGRHKTSMLQDLEAGKPLEIGAVVELAGLTASSLDDYRATGDYAALRNALATGEAAVIREVTDAGLLGRVCQTNGSGALSVVVLLEEDAVA